MTLNIIVDLMIVL